MKRMRIAKIVTAVSTLAMVVQPIAALAAPLDDVTDSVVQQKVNLGALTMNAPADMSLPDIVVSTEDQWVGYTQVSDYEGGDKGMAGVPLDPKELENLKVDDARGSKTLAQPGWSATVMVEDFADGDGVEPWTIDVTNVTLAPNDKEKSASANIDDVVLGNAEALLDTGDDGISDAKTVATAAATKGRGRFQMDVGFKMRVPSNTGVANYSSTFTFTVV